MVRVPWVDLKTTQILHKKGAKTPVNSNHLRAPHPQIVDTLHYLQKIHQKLGYLNPKTDPGDPIPTYLMLRRKIKLFFKMLVSWVS